MDKYIEGIKNYFLYGTSFWGVFQIFDSIGLFGFMSKIFGLGH